MALNPTALTTAIKTSLQSKLDANIPKSEGRPTTAELLPFAESVAEAVAEEIVTHFLSNLEIQVEDIDKRCSWIPAFAGMTITNRELFALKLNSRIKPRPKMGV